MIHYDNINQKIYSNRKFEELAGFLDETKARITLGEFLYNNLGFTVELLLGLKLFPYQELLLRAWFDHNFSMAIMTRGGAKSFCAAVFSTIYPIFYPNTRIVVASNSFRSSRRIMQQVEKFLLAKDADLIRQCYTAEKGAIALTKRQDEMKLDINGGSIVCLPLVAQCRGTRADILICDEFLQIPEDMYESVLMPFLTAKNNVQEQLRIKQTEDSLIETGNFDEADRTVLDSGKKIIAMSSASYDFEFCHKLYKEWTEKAIEGNTPRSYFTMRMGWEALPDELIEADVVEEARSGGGENASFKREFGALFSSSSDGYFNIKKLHQHTVKDGDLPCVQLKGTPDSKYILSIDPSFSSSKSSDFFAMGLFLINPDDRSITQVHSYGHPGEDLNVHLKYFTYLLESFNIVMIIGDFGGANFDFIKVANESAIFTERNLKLDFFDGDFDADNYIEEITKAKNSYNLLAKKICKRQIFSADWLRKSNEWLQAQIDYGKVKFASRLSSHDVMLRKATEMSFPFLEFFPGISKEKQDESRKADWISILDDMQEQTKKQLALIEVTATSQGTMRFDLPQHLKRSKSVDRARRDNYTTLLMANWAAKAYLDMVFTPEEKKTYSFKPFVIR